MSEAMDSIDVTKKGAALAAAEAGRFDALPIYKPEIECASREDIRALQLEKLKETVAYAYERVPYYRQKLDEMGVAPSDIQTLEDVRKLPFTDKAVLRETFPFGLFAVPLDDIRELHSSSGTTGKPVVVGYTDDDMDMWSECIARLVQMAGVVPGDIAQCLPSFVVDSMKAALPILGRRLQGFDSGDALLTAPETRSSSPVRILRDESGQSALRGLYPCGEGAGYAGGILSAAADGMRCAEKIWEVYS